MEQRKQIPFRISHALNEQLTEVAEYEEMSKNALMNKELKKVVKEYWNDDDFLNWLKNRNEKQGQ